MLDARQPVTLRTEVARALGRNRLDARSESKLRALLQRPELKTSAALALMLGGSTSSAHAAVQSYEGLTPRALAELKEAWSRSFTYFGRDDVPEVLAGLGTSILTTSRGVMTGKAAVKAGVGGEVLCNIW